MKIQLRARQQGSTLRQTCIIRSMIDARGLPTKNFVLACVGCMVHWDANTGEVKTIEYNTGSKISFISYDESWVYKKFMEHSHVTLENSTIR